MKTTVLMYHALADERSAISLPPSVFQRQMRLLHEGGFRVISMSDLVSSLQSGAELPGKSVVLTFDDGFESVYTNAFPVLQRYGFPATVFLVADYCGKTNDWPSQPGGIPSFPIMDWRQAQELDRHGIEFGAHTCTHPRLDLIPPGDLHREILESQTIIQDKLGHLAELFSYPYGRSSAASAALVQRSYSGACTTELGTVGPHSDPLALERVDVYYVQQQLLFRGLSSNLFSMYLGMRRPVRKLASALLQRDWQ